MGRFVVAVRWLALVWSHWQSSAQFDGIGNVITVGNIAGVVYAWEKANATLA